MILRPNRQKSIIAGAASFLFSVASAAALRFGLAVICAVLAAAAAGAYMLTLMVAPSGRKFYLLVPVAAALCAAVINSFSVSVGILALSPFVAGHIMARFTERGTGKTGAIIRAEAAIFLIFVVSAVVSFAMTYKTVSPAAFVEAVRTLVGQIKTETAKTLDEMDLYGIMSGFLDLSSYSKAQFIKEIVSEVFFLAEIIIPSVVITLLGAFAYLSTAFFSLARKISKAEQDGDFGKWRLMPSHLSSSLAVSSMMIYIILTVASRITESAVMSVISYVVLNLVIILTPPMFVCGVRGLGGKFRSRRYRGSAILVTALAVGATVILPIYGFFYGVMFVALQGAWDMILFYRIQKFSSGEENNENDENDMKG